MAAVDLNLLPGKWVNALSDPNLLYLRKTTRKEQGWIMVINEDHTILSFHDKGSKAKALKTKAEGHPDLWAVRPPNIFFIKRAIPPMPDIEEPDWFFEESQFEVLFLGSDCLAIYDNENILVFRRELPDPWAEDDPDAPGQSAP